jgi:WD40 repeat protein
LSGHTDLIRAVIVTVGGRQIVSASDDRTIRIWNFDTGSTERVIETQKHWTRALAATFDGERLVSGSEDRTVKVWDLRDGVELQTLRGHRARVNSVAISPDGKRIVSGQMIAWSKCGTSLPVQN